ncbi:hypothetical protein [Sphingomicrobium astaxanthinifaciens]|uniref:hypothetical protein n=1 Tax=Sphingomicrobium astaxanthinifaciens TaxID=1227949 RepID=UPI001FCC7A7F|nr:hypothetical protein [Sphingomicrobium astaxanthinifaciens]MCJ7421841.1 hypothetical protein [Sphingomicrobium astaxanthinifaciens]
MESTSRLAFEDFLRSLRAAYRVTFAALCERQRVREEDVRLFGLTFAAGFLFTSLFIA